jgi:hypothetical protein
MPQSGRDHLVHSLGRTRHPDPGVRPARPGSRRELPLLSKTHRARPRPPCKCIALVLQSGGALGVPMRGASGTQRPRRARHSVRRQAGRSGRVHGLLRRGVRTHQSITRRAKAPRRLRSRRPRRRRARRPAGISRVLRGGTGPASLLRCHGDRRSTRSGPAHMVDAAHHGRGGGPARPTPPPRGVAP